MSHGWQNPQTAMVPATLPLLSAWTTPLELISSNAVEALLVLSYVRGGAAGAMDWSLEGSIFSIPSLVPAGTGEWSSETLWSAGVQAAGVDTINTVQRDIQRYTAVGALQETISFPISLNGNVERIRFRARETGNPGAPGELGMVIQLRV